MEPLVDTVCEDPRWEGFGLAARADAAAGAALAALGLAPEGLALCVMGCDDAHIAALNAAFRAKGQATNVLSWPSEDRAAELAGAMPDLPEPGDAQDPESLGDIAIAWETCTREAQEQGISFDAHVTHLIVHGVLHLLGFDHIDQSDAELMEATEVRILASLGVADPY
ncbi:MAG: rRNA maturation RNase YbeY [Paracoccaceae bacterium]|nr:rRNA maturation RNase YbeY [Paracoccaceae bacterium]